MSKFKHYIITNRTVISENEHSYIREDGKEEAKNGVRFATYEAEPLTDFKDKKIKAKEDIDVIPEVKNTQNINYKKMGNDENLKGSRKFFKEIYELLKEDEGDLLVFVPGFNNDLRSALLNVHKLHRNFVENPDSNISKIVLFTWPSMSNLLKYRSDERDAEQSGYALARVYLKMLEFFKQFLDEETNPPCMRKIHLMSHSMGNQVLQAFIKYINNSKYPMVQLFDQLIMTGADVDDDIFEVPNELSHVNRLFKRTHVYFHDSDDALRISNLTKHADRRLGFQGPKNMYNIPTNVYVVDASDTRSQNPSLVSRFINHWYHHHSETVVNDMTKVLNGEHSEDIEERKFIEQKRHYRL